MVSYQDFKCINREFRIFAAVFDELWIVCFTTYCREYQHFIEASVLSDAFLEVCIADKNFTLSREH